MPRTVCQEVYKFEELTDKAKEKARDWYREGEPRYDWWDSIYDDAKTIGLKIEAFDCDRRTIDGKLTESVAEVARRIFDNHGKQCETYKTAQRYFLSKHLGLKDAAIAFTYSIKQDYLEMLDKEVEWLMSDEQVDESIKANEYEFTDEGKRA